MAGETLGYEHGFRLIRAKDGSIVREPLPSVTETIPQRNAQGQLVGPESFPRLNATPLQNISETIPTRDAQGQLVQPSSLQMVKQKALAAALRLLGK